MPMEDPRQIAPAASRNREPIAAILRNALPASGLVLEVASGSGEHVVHFARTMKLLDWQPTDANPAARASIAAYLAHEELSNIRPPLALDAASGTWPVTQAAAILCINMVHISPWESTLGLLRGAARILPPDGLLYLYGPFRRAGVETAARNEAFDIDLRQRNPQWGVRDLETVAEAAAKHQMRLERAIEMPANNLSVIFRK